MSKVYLLGAGPGDVGLVTLKTIEVLKEADCVLYDRLVNPKLLNYCKKDAEILYVGKQKGHHSKKQDEINQLLVDKSSQFEIIARLKGGDPYVFGRGSEETLFLKEHDIPFEVVPGISSSVSVLTYAGIPITHRELSRAFHVYSAHTRENTLANIDFESIARNEETHVFLMGLTKLDQIVSKLLAAGKRKNCPIAIISNGTTPKQKVLVSTLENVLDEFNKNPLESPAIIVVGDVVRLRESLNFYEEKPLFGKTFFFPRVNDSASTLTTGLEEMGANVVEKTVSKSVKHTFVITEVNWDYLIFSSKIAVQYFMNQLFESNLDIRHLFNTKICAVGKSTQKELNKYGIQADIVPSEYTSEALEKVLIEQVNKNTKVCIPKDQDVKNKWKTLEIKCQIEYIDLYHKEEQEFEMVECDHVIFTCSSSADIILSKGRLSPNTIIYSIGPLTTKTVQSFGYTNIIESKIHTNEGLLNTILEMEN